MSLEFVVGWLLPAVAFLVALAAFVAVGWPVVTWLRHRRRQEKINNLEE